MQIRQKILESPACKTAIFVASTMLAGIFSAIFITEITAPTGMDWAGFYKARSFYVLLVLTAFIYLYNKEAIRFEKNILNYKDTEYCMAYVRSKYIPEAADRYRKLISEGRVEELRQAMDEVQRLLR